MCENDFPYIEYLPYIVDLSFESRYDDSIVDAHAFMRSYLLPAVIAENDNAFFLERDVG